jgi:hypothetical protein
MKQIKIVFLLIVIITASVMIFFSCYPGMGPGQNAPVLSGEQVTINGPTTVVMPVNAIYPIRAQVTNDDVTDFGNNITYELIDGSEFVELVDNTITTKAPGDATIRVISESRKAAATFFAQVRTIEIRPKTNQGQVSKDYPLQMEALIFPGGELVDSILRWYVFDDITKYDSMYPSEDNSTTTEIISTGDQYMLRTTNTTGDTTVDVITSSTYGDIISTPVTVKIIGTANPIPIVRIAEGSSKIVAEGESLTLHANVGGTSDNSLFDWTFTNDYGNPVSSVSNGTITINTTNGLGDATITATLKTEPSATATFEVNVRDLQMVTEAGSTIQVLAGHASLAANLVGGEETGQSTNGLVWRIVDDSALSLLGDVNLTQDGELTASGVLNLGTVTIRVEKTGTTLFDQQEVTLVGVANILN